MLNIYTFTTGLLFTLFIILSCNSPEAKKETTSYQPESVKKEIEAANKEFAELFAKGDSIAVGNYFTLDAKSMGPNVPSVVGRGAIQTLYAGWINAGVNNLSLTTTGLWGNDEMQTEEGLFTFSDKAGNEVDKGKYLLIWKKENGKWKIFRDCYNSDLPIQITK
jgi:ketosteroid isomerase-like protein